MKIRSFVLLAGMLSAFAFAALGGGCKTTATTSTGSGGGGTCDPTACPDVDCNGVMLHGCVGDHCGTQAELCGGGTGGTGGSGVGGSGGGPMCAPKCAEAITDPCPGICDPNEEVFAALFACVSMNCVSECGMANCGDAICAMCFAIKCVNEFAA